MWLLPSLRLLAILHQTMGILIHTVDKNLIIEVFLHFCDIEDPTVGKLLEFGLDDFLKLSGKELLNHAGSVSAEVANLKANEEYDKFRERTQYQLSPVEIHFLEAFEAERKRLGGKKS